MSAETVLMWTAAIILAAVALAACAFAVWAVIVVVHGYNMRYRVRGLTRDQIGDCIRLAARYRYENGTAGQGPVSPPVDPVRQPRWHPEDEEV
ncbi:hypothetical protein F4561_006580 [Lipingzhangella halophila]|uniref:Uncharacterized protein n=1 Tax=Lipingzhangella halophila TaxID=1783352 RepID=A0A7W7W6E6_9ACTN|nr:hypothetical protein [Lipingzhangella halophila]MBB4935671.1 hypothetical protein [Lipingzhangella halophila]